VHERHSDYNPRSFGSVEILNQTSVKGDNAETVFAGYRKGGCHSGGGEAPENVSKEDVFYRAVLL